jgi:hypothetical protein
LYVRSLSAMGQVSSVGKQIYPNSMGSFGLKKYIVNLSSKLRSVSVYDFRSVAKSISVSVFSL